MKNLTKVVPPLALVAMVLAGTARGAAAYQKGGGGATPKLSGLYRAFPAVAQFGAAVGEAYVLSPNGDVHRGWPGTQSAFPFDFARARKETPESTGKYAVAGDKIAFRWSDGRSETAAFSQRRDPKTGRTIVAIGPSFAYRIVPFAGTLNGAFEPSTYQGGFDNARAIGDRIVFSPNGTFVTEGDNATKGRYKIVGATLNVTLSNGDRRRYSLHVFAESKGAPATVLIDGRPFNTTKG